MMITNTFNFIPICLYIDKVKCPEMLHHKSIIFLSYFSKHIKKALFCDGHDIN